jgi:glycosyltransferase involved in cell wall biosynthesis
VVHFAIPPGPVIGEAEARAMADHYGLPEKYIFMPNQFWRHKNHGLVLEALRLLKDQGTSIVIAASGMQSDTRDPSYFPSFFERIQKLGLTDDFRLLGMIPYPHLALLMRASTAMINASLFEGWSTTVEEAKSLGTPLILSDIDVHHEQMGDGALYFDRTSAASLANVIRDFVPASQDERNERCRRARQDALNRVADFADHFCAFVEASARKTS